MSAAIAGPVLVTGANGLLGRATLARIASARRVYGLVRAEPKRPPPDGATMVVHDLRQAADPDLPEAPETIVHLAQSPRYRDFPEGALDVFEVNVASTQRLLDYARRSGVRRFVYASSGGVYGHSEAPFREDAPLCGEMDLNHYLAGKISSEILLRAYSREFITITLRLFFMYGPGQRETMLVPRLVNNVLQGQPILLQGPNGMRANPVYVDDAAAAVAAALALTASDTVNVAGPQVLTMREIGVLIGEAIGRAPRFEYQPGARPRHLIGDTGKMGRVLGAPPRTGFAEGVKYMLEAVRSSV